MTPSEFSIIFQLETDPAELSKLLTQLVTEAKDNNLLGHEVIIHVKPYKETEFLDKEALEYFLRGEMGYCGCGQPDLVLDLLQDVLQTLEDMWGKIYAAKSSNVKRKDHEAGRAALEKLLGKKGCYYWFLYELNRLDLTDHGGNVSGSWLSGKGEALLAALKKWKDDVEI